MKNHIALVVYLSVVACLTMTSPLAAQDTTIAVADLLAPWMESLIAAFMVLIIALMTWVTTFIRKKTGVEVDFINMQTFQQALENAAGYVLEKTKDTQIDVRHPAVRDAIRLVNSGAPDALKKWGIGPEEIAERIVGKIGLARAGTTDVVELSEVISDESPRGPTL